MNASEVNYRYELTKPTSKDVVSWISWLRAAYAFLPYEALQDLLRNEELQYRNPFGDMSRPECPWCGKLKSE